MRIKYNTISNVNLVEQMAYFKPKIMGSIPHLYTTTKLFSIASWNAIPHQLAKKNSKPIFKAKAIAIGRSKAG